MTDERQESPGGQPPAERLEVVVERLVPGGLGMGFDAGRTVFIPFTAPGDRVVARVERVRKRVVHATLERVLTPGEGRQAPPCPWYARCGGCQMQHLTPAAYREAKSGFVSDALLRLAKLPEPLPIAPLALPAEMSGYRRRAGFKVRWVNGRVLLGFYAPGSHRVMDLPGCPVLHPQLARLMDPLRHLIRELSVRQQLPQVDASCGETGSALVFHLLRPLNARDKQQLSAFAQEQGVAQVWLQRGRKSELRQLVQGADPTYTLNGLTIAFRPGDFTQVNLEQNRVLLEAVRTLAGRGEKALDLFCGIGNFTLPLADRFQALHGVEGYGPAVARAKENARRNHLANLTFAAGDLFQPEGVAELPWEGVSTVLLNPPREGAVEVAKALISHPVQRVVYVSCDPATFARDAAILHHGGYRLEQLLPVDMFPWTQHVELVAGWVRG